MRLMDKEIAAIAHNPLQLSSQFSLRLLEQKYTNGFLSDLQSIE